MTLRRSGATGRPAARAVALGVAWAGAVAVGCERWTSGEGGASAAKPSAAQHGAARTAHEMSDHEWLPSNSGPNGCPMRILDGGFLAPSGAAVNVPRARVHAGWGRPVSAQVVGTAAKPVPDRMALLFFSYLENQLYRGEFTLPRDSIARLFREGYRSLKDPSGRGTYTLLVVGVAPGGAVAVWASGPERQVEVFFGQAERAELDWHRAMGMPPTVDRQASVERTLATAARVDTLVPRMQQQVSAGRWARYRTRYRWRPVFEGVGRPERLAGVEFLNGERDYIDLSAAAPAQAVPRPAPGFILFADPQSRRNHWLTFDEEEVFAAFARVGGAERPVELVFAAPRPGTSELQLLVRGAADTVALRQVKQEAYGGR